ncbi:MAG: SDR family NAD(P)-dependent oxidoreductase [Gammaproteobacteria bacterium]|nr:SDR family NAD(P)-dependent oxidoreductase [Gammaproteobacteria bacterium]MCY4344512.1 SDR family NAD(P)-dependent oxidoreductase [Gammaproteobacteria bacterium]
MGIMDGKAAVVTGAAVGLGNAFARALADEGAALAVCDLRPDIEGFADQVNAPTLAVQADVSDAGAVRGFIDQTLHRFGRIDVLVSNAGVWTASEASDPIDKTLRDAASQIGTNLKGVFLCGRAVIPAMIRQGGGHIININTDHVHTCGAPFEEPGCDASNCPFPDTIPRPTGGGPAMDLYDAAKWGINGLTFGWCQALKPHGIRVNGLCMGATDSHMLRGFHNFDPPPEEEASWMRPREIARVMIELIAEGPRGRTGENIGFCMGRPVALPPPRANPYFMESGRAV